MKGIFLFLFFLLPAYSVCQHWSQYNVNTNNGLPSNHVYWVTVDSYGYLWICTDNGIAKYNGYQFKVFNLSNGIPNCDIWGVFEDCKGKMWLQAISKDIGYIYKDRYRKAYVRDTFLRMYPRQMRQGSQGILFLNPSLKNDSRFTLCKERNDTIYDCHTDEIYKVPARSVFVNILDASNNIIGLTDSEVFKISPFDTPVIVKKICKYPRESNSRAIESITLVYNHDLITINEAIHILNLEDCTQRTISLFQPGEFCVTTNVASNFFYIYSNKCTYKFNEKMVLVDRFTPEQLIREKVSNSSYTSLLFEDAFWGDVIATTDNGLYINNRVKALEPSPLNLKGNKYIGRTANDISCWWNKKTQCITGIKNNKLLYTRKYYQITDITKIIPYSNDSSLLIAGNNTYWLDNRNWNTSYIFSNVNHFIDPTGRRSGDLIRSPFFRCRDAVIVNGKELYLLELAAGVCKLNIYNDTARIDILDSDRYARFFYDPFKKTLGAYNDNTVTLFDMHGNKKYTTNSLSGTLQLDNIERILVDTIYDNIFIKSNNKFFLLDCYGHCQELYKNFRLDNAIVCLHKDMIFTAGRFGLLCSKIWGKGSISPPLLYANIKSTLYHEISDIEVNDDNVLINTDNAVYTVKMPANAEISENNSNNISQRYKFLLTYKDSTIKIKAGDTLSIDQNNALLEFDVINPFGRGQIKYSYRISEIDTEWHELKTNELHIPALNPNSHYTLRLLAFDDVWRSREIKMDLFIVPYWWQTGYGKKIVWGTGFLAFCILCYIIVLITKRNVLKKNQKRNMQLELELRAIHSQINPHFIFNTLGTALSFIDEEKTEAAYTHIVKFSNLLRAYLKSSRSKVITVASEITNLRNYIDLQRVRFDSRFNYDISVQDGIDIDNTYIPSLLLQPIVENAITHGLFHKEGEGFLKIGFQQINGDLICIIEDNGIGREQSKIINFETTLKEKSYGNLLVKDLVGIFNKYETMNISIHYIDKPMPDTGTIVTLVIKNPFYEQRL